VSAGERKSMKNNKCTKCDTGIIYCVFTGPLKGKIIEHCTDCDYTRERGLTRKMKKWIPFMNRRKS